MQTRTYKPRRSWTSSFVTLILIPSLAWAAGKPIAGLTLPGGAVEVGENRYRSTQSFEETLKFFGNIKGLNRKPIARQPQVKAVHFESLDPKSGFEGINVYEANKEVRIHVIVREGS